MQRSQRKGAHYATASGVVRAARDEFQETYVANWNSRKADLAATLRAILRQL